MFQGFTAEELVSLHRLFIVATDATLDAMRRDVNLRFGQPIPNMHEELCGILGEVSVELGMRESASLRSRVPTI